MSTRSSPSEIDLNHPNQSEFDIGTHGVNPVTSPAFFEMYQLFQVYCKNR